MPSPKGFFIYTPGMPALIEAFALDTRPALWWHFARRISEYDFRFTMEALERADQYCGDNVHSVVKVPVMKKPPEGLAYRQAFTRLFWYGRTVVIYLAVLAHPERVAEMIKAEAIQKVRFGPEDFKVKAHVYRRRPPTSSRPNRSR